MELKDFIAIAVYIVTIIGWVYKLKYNQNQIMKDIDKYQNDISTNCERIEELNIQIEKIATTDDLKQKYQTAVIKDVLQPLLESMNTDFNKQMREYVDMRIQNIDSNIKDLRDDSKELKSTLKEIVSDFKLDLKEIVSTINKK